MGELVAGKPLLQLNFRVSLPLDLVSVMSLLYRAVPGSGLDPWLVATRRSMPDALLADLDLLHGFSGRLLYYMEEPILRFRPLDPGHLDAGIDDLLAYLHGESAATYRTMVADALGRVHRDLGDGRATPLFDDEPGWRQFVEPALTTATADAVWSLIQRPEVLKERTIGLIHGIWRDVYGREFLNRLPMLSLAARLAETEGEKGFGQAFASLTGSRLPTTLLAGLGDIKTVTFCPSAHLGEFISYIRYPPDVVVYFGAPDWISRSGGARRTADDERPSGESGVTGPTSMADDDLLDALRALADPNRLRIIELLGRGELYAQEIVGRLGIAQSAVSRHLTLLERSGLVQVKPRRGMKYYRIDGERMAAVAEAIRSRSSG